MWVFHHTALLCEDLALSRRHTSSNCFSLLAFLISPASLGEFFCHILNLKWSLILQTFFFLTILKHSFTKPLSWYPVMKKDVEIVWCRHRSTRRPREAVAYLKDPFITGSLAHSPDPWSHFAHNSDNWSRGIRSMGSCCLEVRIGSAERREVCCPWRPCSQVILALSFLFRSHVILTVTKEVAPQPLKHRGSECWKAWVLWGKRFSNK